MKTIKSYWKNSFLALVVLISMVVSFAVTNSHAKSAKEINKEVNATLHQFSTQV